MKTRLLDRFTKVESIDQIPRKGTFFVLTRSTTFLGKAIQGFQRLMQWLHFTKDTELIPNHCDIVRDGYAIGALINGVRKHEIKDHFNSRDDTVFYLIYPTCHDLMKKEMWNFAESQKGDGYKFFDILKYAYYSFTLRWRKKEPLDRDKWTCYSLGASCYNYGVGEEFFPNPFRTTPYGFCLIINQHEDKFI